MADNDITGILASITKTATGSGDTASQVVDILGLAGRLAEAGLKLWNDGKAESKALKVGQETALAEASALVGAEKTSIEKRDADTLAALAARESVKPETKPSPGVVAPKAEDVKKVGDAVEDFRTKATNAVNLFLAGLGK
jgi:hypothetical protein